MSCLRLIIMGLLLAGALAVQAAPPAIWANREWEVLPAPGDTTGKQQITATWYAFPERMLALAFEEVVDPATPNAAPTKRRFIYQSVARWGWIPWGFFTPTIVRVDDGKRTPVTWGPLRALNVLEGQGDARVMADFVWGVLQGDQEIGSLVMRCVLYKDEPTWLYTRVFLVGDPALQIERISLLSMGGMGRKRPGAELRFVGLNTVGPLPAWNTKLPWDEYWMLASYPINAEEIFNVRGASGIFLQEDLANVVFTGGWGAGIDLVPTEAGRRSVRFALSDQYGTPDVWIKQLRAQAPARKQRLATLDWRPQMDRNLSTLVNRMMRASEDLPRNAPVLVAWQARQGALDAAIRVAAKAEIGSPEELAYGFEAQKARAWLDEHWGDVVSAYLAMEVPK